MHSPFNIETWNRKEAYYYFKDYDYPLVNICCNVDITTLHNKCKTTGASLNLALHFCSLAALNQITEFKLRIKDGQVIQYDKVHAGATMLLEDNSIRFCLYQYSDNYETFLHTARQCEATVRAQRTTDQRLLDQDLIHYSVLPWIAFHSITTNNRAVAFENNKQYATRVVNAFAICGADERTVADIQGINRKIQGKRAGDVPDPDVKPKKGENAPKTISVSQLSYDNQRKHFKKLIEAITLEEKYRPNEPDLVVDAIAQKLEEMESTNTLLGEAKTEWGNRLADRNNTMYAPLTGLVDIAKATKKYVKSVYTATHPRFVQVNEIPFKVIKDKKKK